MTTEQLQHFLMLAECLNYTAAAERLFISQSTLSRSISAFEAELQTKLFERSKNRVTLTPAGKLMRDRAPDMLHRMHALEVDCRELGDGVRGRLHIGIPDDQQVNPWVVRAAARFHRVNPNITLVYDAGPLDELRTRLVTGACDVVLAAQFGAGSCVGLHALSYAVDEPVLVVPAAMAEGLPDELPAAALAAQFPGARCMLPRYSAEYWQRILAPHRPAMQLWPMAGSDRTTVLSVSAGEGLALANLWSAFYGLPTVRCIRLTGLPEKPHLTALCARDRTNPLAESFLEGLPEDVPLMQTDSEST